MKGIFIFVAIVALALIGWWFFGRSPQAAEAPTEANPTGWETYSDDQFSISYPKDYVVDPGYQYQGAGPGNEIPGVSFTIPAALSEGTNLGSDTRLSVEHVTGECDAGRFVEGGSSSVLIDENVGYTVASSTGAGAGNRYEEIVYALSDTAPCLLVRYFIHWGVFENYEPGTVIEFDHAALIASFDQIRRTLVVNR